MGACEGIRHAFEANVCKCYCGGSMCQLPPECKALESNNHACPKIIDTLIRRSCNCLSDADCTPMGLICKEDGFCGI